MKKLDNIKIGNFTYKITYKPLSISGEGRTLYGTISETKQEVEISTDYTEERQKSTLLHECIHGVGYAMNLEFDENTVTLLEEGIFRLIRENKNLIKYIMEDVDEKTQITKGKESGKI